MFVGLAVDDNPGLTAEAGVTVKGMDVLICCLEVAWANSSGECQLLLLFVTGDDDVAEGAMSTNNCTTALGRFVVVKTGDRLGSKVSMEFLFVYKRFRVFDVSFCAFGSLRGQV